MRDNEITQRVFIPREPKPDYRAVMVTKEYSRDTGTVVLKGYGYRGIQRIVKILDGTLRVHPTTHTHYRLETPFRSARLNTLHEVWEMVLEEMRWQFGDAR